MRILGIRPVTLVAFGTGFLLGSRTGTGPWEAVNAKARELQGCGGAEVYGGNGSGQGATAPAAGQPSTA
ncbi:MAG: hypothetical protein ACRDY7_00285 [Acidimicrobiia bacterium]